MTRLAQHEYAAAVRGRYGVADKEEKGRILDEFCRVTGCHRKAAIRILHHSVSPQASARGRPCRYGPDLIPVLKRLWETSDRPCSKLLVAVLPTLIAALERHEVLRLTPQMRELLLSLSPATLDRLISPVRRLGRQPRRQHSPRNTLHSQIPLRTFGEWQDVAPGSLQGDLVFHCGQSMAGFFLSTLVAVDVASGWTELEAIWGIGKQRVGTGVHHVRQHLPFPFNEWHTDNGSEFLNRILIPWCRREGIRVTRGRGYRKNDQAWVEQKNWLAVRRLVGYDRYSSQAAYALLQRLYRLIPLQLNFFRPIRKLIGKQRLGAKVFKRYDHAQTPYQRLLASGVLTDTQREALEREFLAINPDTVASHIDQTLEVLWKLREHR